MSSGIDPEIEEAVEKAMPLLLKQEQAPLYREYYKLFKSAPNKDVRYYNAYRLLRAFLALKE